MQDFVEFMKVRRQFLKKLISQKKRTLKNAPEGVLNIAKAGSRVQYYYKQHPSDRQKRYMRRKEMPLIRKLCQKDYDKKVILLAEKELKQVERLLDTYETQTCNDVYAHLSEERKELVVPIEPTDETYVSGWEQEEYERKPNWNKGLEYYTDKGEHVRSKSEILIANTLAKYGVPYKYEKPLYLDEYGKLHPDFTVLNVKHRKEMYWEHMGMMDEPSYVEHALERLEAYEKNGIYPGEKLILTYETARCPLKTKTITDLIKRYLN